ncbi:hypothetical protein GGI43DRAFT_406454, partial [Trichoderma evansii]
MVADSHPHAMSATSSDSTERTCLESSQSYGYIWADWLYGHDKDKFMVDVYNDCRDIDDCADAAQRAAQPLLLRNKVLGSKKPWVEGIADFIEFESQLLVSGVPQLDILHDDDCAIATLHAAYLHGAVRGTCRTASGAEWIGQLGEFCAAAVHQGFKWVRMSGGVADWELPTLGESWCKGAALWGIVSLYMAVDIAGADAGNDAALERIHLVIGAHHFAGSSWLKYRGAHPHKWWSTEVRGRAPSEVSIRRFGEKHGWPEEMMEILCRGANHVSSWKNPPFNPVHLERMRNLLIWDHTPRLKSRLIRVVDELIQLVDNVTESEAEEILSRCGSWIVAHTIRWHGRGDRNDRVVEVSAPGAVLGVLRESRPHVSNEVCNRVVAWSRRRIGHLSPEMQDLFLGRVLQSVQLRGRVPGVVEGYTSGGAEPSRFVDEWWHVATWAAILSHPAGGKDIPVDIRELVVSFFNVWTKKRRIVGKDMHASPAEEDGLCPVCTGNSLFEASVDNRPSVAVWQCTTWGTLLYHNLGLGTLDDIDLGC